MMRKFVSFAFVLLVLVLGACVMNGTGKKALMKANMQITYTDAKGAAAMLAADPNIGIVDVRTGIEYNAGHIKGAGHNGFIGFGFAKRLEGLDRSRTYLVTCRTGHRSIPALKSFAKLGFTHIVHLDGGMQAWKKASFPIVKGNSKG